MGENDSWWSNLDTTAKAIISVIGIATAAIAAYAGYDKLNTQRNDCTMSGITYDQGSQRPLAGVRVGYARNNTGTFDGNQGQNISVTTLAQSGSDGTFSGECNGARDEVSASSFEILTTGGSSSRLPGLPCLRTHSTAQRIRNRGAHTGIRIQVPGC